MFLSAASLILIFVSILIFAFTFLPRCRQALKFLVFVPIGALLLITMVACTESDYHKATQAAAGISSGLSAAEQATEDLATAKAITLDEAAVVLGGLDDATKVNDEYVAQLKTFTSINASNKIVLVSWVNALTASVTRLNANGVLHIKNTDAQKKLAEIVGGIQASIAIVSVIVGVQQSTSFEVSPDSRSDDMRRVTLVAEGPSRRRLVAWSWRSHTTQFAH